LTILTPALFDKTVSLPLVTLYAPFSKDNWSDPSPMSVPNPAFWNPRSLPRTQNRHRFTIHHRPLISWQQQPQPRNAIGATNAIAQPL
jgi:hypothetical protein